MLNFFIDPGRYDIEQFFPPENVIKMSFFHQLREKGIPGIIEYVQKMPVLKISLMALIMIWNALVLLSLVFFAFNRKIDPLIRFLIILIVVYVCVLTGPMGDSRFKMAVYPLLVFTVPFFIEQWRNRRLKKRENGAIGG
jgi:hypothetical protein